MGCCGPKDKNSDDFPYEKVEEFNKLKSEINEIIIDKDHQDRKNVNKLFELFNKTSNKISEYENEIKKLKNQNQNLNNDLLKGLNEDIKQLRDYNHTLNNLIKESEDNEIVNKTEQKKEIGNNLQNEFENGKKITEKDIIIDEVKNYNNDLNIEDNGNIKILKNFNNKKNNLENFLEDDFENGARHNFENATDNDFQIEFNNDDNGKKENSKDLINGLNNEQLSSINNNNNDHNDNINNLNNFSQSGEIKDEKDDKIYYKKSVRRNKKSDILNKKSKTNSKKNFLKRNLFGDNEMRISNNINYNEDMENELFERNGNTPIQLDNNLINLIFVLENGEKIELKAKKNERMLDIIEKFDRDFEEYSNIENIELFDKDNEITEKVKNGEDISSLGINNEHIIQIKLKD